MSAGLFRAATNATLTFDQRCLDRCRNLHRFGDKYARHTKPPQVLTVVPYLLCIATASSAMLLIVGGANGAIVPPNGGTAATISSGLSLPGRWRWIPGYVSLPVGY